jgi:nicotinamide phosphoribosyltransferase
MASRPNLIVRTDAYKQGHWYMTVKGTTKFFSYMGPRIGSIHEKVNLFGLQYYLLEYLAGPGRVTMADIEEAEWVNENLFAIPHFNRKMWEKIVKVHGGALPLRICAWDEGEAVPTGFPMFSVVNTDDDCQALTNHFEPLLAKVWYPSTVTTLSGGVIKLLGESVRASGGPEGFERYMLHDFGYRAASSEETAQIGGGSHLVHAQGTDTMACLLWLRDYYGASLKGLASSIAASEHSIMTSLGPSGEIDMVKGIILSHPGELVSLVADSYNYYEFVDAMIDLKAFVDRYKVKLILRPDSTTPTHRTPKDVVLWTLNRLKERLPFTTTQTGHIVTGYNSIWGDGIDPAGVKEIASAIHTEGFAAHCMAYGMGGGLLQKVNRDTERMAMKNSAQERDGKWVSIQKNPLDQSKKSLSGRVQVVETQRGYPLVVTEDEWPHGSSYVKMHPVFENGVITRAHTFDQIRARARRG